MVVAHMHIAQCTHTCSRQSHIFTKSSFDEHESLLLHHLNLFLMTVISARAKIRAKQIDVAWERYFSGVAEQMHNDEFSVLFPIFARCSRY